MAATQARQGRRKETDASEDSVEAEFGGDYSESSIEFIRSLGRKGAQFGEVEPWETEIPEPVTRADCDAAVADLRTFEQQLDAIKQHVPDERERAWVGYKRALVDGVSPEELTWLKLRAYHHGVDALRASRGENAAGDPVDATATSSQVSALATSTSTSTDEAADAVLRAARDMLPSSSEECEPGAEADKWLSVAAASRQQRLGSHLLASGSAGVAVTATPAEGEEAGAAATTLYHPDYLEEQRLLQELARQRQQRSQAFVFSLALALGASVVRWWVRRGKARRGTGAAETPKRVGSAAAMPQ